MASTSAPTQMFTSYHKPSSRVLAPPGGQCSGIFGWEEQETRSPARNTAVTMQSMQPSCPSGPLRQYRAAANTHHIRRKHKVTEDWMQSQLSHTQPLTPSAFEASFQRNNDTDNVKSHQPQQSQQAHHSQSMENPMESTENVMNLLAKLNFENEFDDDPVDHQQHEQQQQQHHHHHHQQQQQQQQQHHHSPSPPQQQHHPPHQQHTPKQSTPKHTRTKQGKQTSQGTTNGLHHTHTLKSSSKSSSAKPKPDTKKSSITTPVTTPRIPPHHSSRKFASSKKSKFSVTKVKTPTSSPSTTTRKEGRQTNLHAHPTLSSPLVKRKYVHQDKQHPDLATKLSSVASSRAEASRRSRKAAASRLAEKIALETKIAAPFKNKFTSHHTSNRILAPPGGRSSIKFQ